LKEITLNYVSPDARFRGVSWALPRALETRARERDNSQRALTSTETARRFYRANGYVEIERVEGKFGAPASYSILAAAPSTKPRSDRTARARVALTGS
jgi:hypothetical protein